MNAFPSEASAGDQVAPAVTAPDVLRREFRSNMGQVSRQSLTFFAGTIFTMGAGYLVKIYVARVLGAELLGIYALGMTLVSLAQLIGTLGLTGTAARYVAVYKATHKHDELRGFLSRSVGIVLFLNLAMSIGLLLAGGWIGRRLYHSVELGKYIPWFAALAFLGALNVFYCQILAGFKDVAKRTVITNFIGTTLVILLTVAFLAVGFGMPGYLWAQVLTSVAVVALLVSVAWKLTPPAARFSWSTLPPLDPEIKAFAVACLGMGAVEFLVAQADKIIIGFYLNPTLVGIYVVASTLSALIAIILQSVNQIFAPVIADLHAQARRDVLQSLFQTLTKWILGLTLPLAVVMIAFAHPLMRVFGRGFEAGWPVLVIGAVGQLVNCGVGSVGYLLLMSGNQRQLLKVQFSMVAISLVVNITLIPVLGIIGAALASACVNVAGNLWNLIEVRKALDIFPFNRSYLRLGIPGLLAAGVVLLVRMWTASYAHPWLAILAALVFAYLGFAASAIRFSLDPNDRIIVEAVWSQLSRNWQRS